LHSECVFLQGSRVCSWRVQFGYLVEFLCLLAKRLDVALEEEWTRINLGVLDPSYLCLDLQLETTIFSLLLYIFQLIILDIQLINFYRLQHYNFCSLLFWNSNLCTEIWLIHFWQVHKSWRENISLTWCKISKNICSHIIDSGLCCNCFSARLVDKLNFEVIPHPKPYKLHWINDGWI